MHTKRPISTIGLGLAAAILATPAGGTALTYHALTPCRLVDTRIQNFPMAAGEVRAFQALSNLGSQGGSQSGCGIPPIHGSDFRHRAESIVVNLVAANAAGPGDLRVFAGSDAAAPLASVINYSAGQTIAVGTTIPLRTDTTGDDFKIQADVSGTHVVIDVQGYYSRSTATTFVARLKSIPGSAGNPVTVFGPITGSAPVTGDAGGTTTRIPPNCTIQNFMVSQTVATPAGGGTRAFSLRKNPDTVLHNCVIGPGADIEAFHCESTAQVSAGGANQFGPFVFLQAFSVGAVPSTEARVVFEMTCQ